jgi:hypothetical protein
MLIEVNDRAADDLGTSKLRRIAAETERTIIEAIEAGDFRGLSGEGMPLKLDGAEAGDRWAALHVLRNAEFVPEWSALRREIDDELGRIVRRVRSHRAWIAERRALLETMPAERIVNSVRATAERDAAARRTIAESVAELNRSIARYNALVPVFGLQLPLVSVERVLREAS